MVPSPGRELSGAESLRARERRCMRTRRSAHVDRYRPARHRGVAAPHGCKAVDGQLRDNDHRKEVEDAVERYRAIARKQPSATYRDDIGPDDDAAIAEMQAVREMVRPKLDADRAAHHRGCLLYTSDAADDLLCVH